MYAALERCSANVISIAAGLAPDRGPSGKSSVASTKASNVPIAIPTAARQFNPHYLFETPSNPRRNGRMQDGVACMRSIPCDAQTAKLVLPAEPPETASNAARHFVSIEITPFQFGGATRSCCAMYTLRKSLTRSVVGTRCSRSKASCQFPAKKSSSACS